MLKELYRLQIFVAAVLVRAPLSVPATVVQIEHRRDGIHAESVHMVLVHPVERVRNQEVLDLRLAVVKDLGAPVGMLSLSGIRIFIERLSVEIRKSEGIAREMRRHPVEYHTDACLVHAVYKRLKSLRISVARSRRIVAGHLIAPASVKGIFRNAHEFHMGVAHFLDIGRELTRQGLIREEAVSLVLISPFPGTKVTLVDTEGLLSRVLLGPLPHPRVVLPSVFPGFVRKFRRRSRAEFRAPRIGVRLK